MAQVQQDGKHDGKIIGGVLLSALAISFFGLDGVGKIKSLFSSGPSQTKQATVSNDEIISKSGNTQTLELATKEPDDGKLNNIVFTAEAPQVQKQESKNAVKQDILILTKTSDALSSDRKELPKSTEAPQVRKIQFTTPAEKANPKEFNEKKFGINEAALQEALAQKTPLTRQQKLLIEAEKAREKFDSRSITNF